MVGGTGIEPVAPALRAYAVMRDDVALTSYAQRIHLRSVRRIGLLLKQIEPQRGGDRGGPMGGHPPVGETRTKAAEAAGLSEHQRKTALRVANVPEPQFTRQAESASTPTVTRLAEQGRAIRATSAGRAPARALGAFKACEALRQFAQFCEHNDPSELARLVDAEDVETVSRYVAVADQWLDQFVTNLPREGAP
jgi:hypothetical protein